MISAWSEEAQHLMPLSRTFDGFVEYAKHVSPTCLIHLERNRYSVPASFANRPVSVRVYPERIVVAGEGQVICEHRRVFNALTLTCEPQANVERYDALRQAREARHAS